MNQKPSECKSSVTDNGKWYLVPDQTVPLTVCFPCYAKLQLQQTDTHEKLPWLLGHLHTVFPQLSKISEDRRLQKWGLCEVIKAWNALRPHMLIYKKTNQKRRACLSFVCLGFFGCFFPPFNLRAWTIRGFSDLPQIKPNFYRTACKLNSYLLSLKPFLNFLW